MALNPETLLSHHDFIRALAKSLVKDETVADDITQQVWTAYLKGPPSPDKPLKRWLAKVTRNTVFFRHRGEKRRQKREQSYALEHSMPSSDEIASREEMRRELIDAVLSLKEPYRSAIFFRYYENKTPEEIAGRTGIPKNTVRTHIQRGLEKLKIKLDKKYGGDRSKWCLLLAPYAGIRLKMLSGVFVMSSASKIGISAAAVLILLCAAFWSLLPEDNPPLPLSASRSASIVDSENYGNGVIIEPRLKGDPRQKVDPLGLDKILEISGKVIDKNSGAPIPNVLVVGMRHQEDGHFSSDVSANTDENGAFLLSHLKPSAYRVVACHTRYEEAYADTSPGVENLSLLLKKDNRLDVYGVVTDDGGKPLSDFEVSLFGAALNCTLRTRTDIGGSYRFEDLPPGGFTLSAQGTKWFDNPVRDHAAYQKKFSYIEVLPDGTKIPWMALFNEGKSCDIDTDSMLILRELSSPEPGFTGEERSFVLLDRDLEINLGAQGLYACWQGVLYDWNHKPVPHGAIYLEGVSSEDPSRAAIDRQTICDEKGGFMIRKLNPGAYRVRLNFPVKDAQDGGLFSLHWKQVSISQLGEFSRDIRLDSASVSGKVVCSHTKKTIQNYPSQYDYNLGRTIILKRDWIVPEKDWEEHEQGWLYPKDKELTYHRCLITAILHSSEGDFRTHVTTNDQGAFFMGGLPRGTYTLYADRLGLTPVVFTLKPSQKIHNLTLQLPITQKATLTLKKLPKECFGNFQVYLENKDSLKTYYWGKSAYYNWKVTRLCLDLSPGCWSVLLAWPSGKKFNQSFVLNAANETAIEIHGDKMDF